ncbi:11093_t:CDS:2 [Rhizophagus irregularis]|nr:11093_t:CDS:2 [Rhizophagus irregularis]
MHDQKRQNEVDLVTRVAKFEHGGILQILRLTVFRTRHSQNQASLLGPQAQ